MSNGFELSTVYSVSPYCFLYLLLSILNPIPSAAIRGMRTLAVDCPALPLPATKLHPPTSSSSSPSGGGGVAVGVGEAIGVGEAVGVAVGAGLGETVGDGLGLGPGC